MAGYNKVSLSRKKELEQPDDVMENLRKFAGFVMKHKVQISIGMAVFFTVIIGISSYRYFSKKAEAEASYLLAQSIRQYDTAVENKQTEKARQETEKALKNIIADYSGTVAAQFARLQLANIYYSLKKNDESIALYEQALTSLAIDPLFEELIQVSLGLCYEAKGENEKALAYFQKAIAVPQAVGVDEALFHIGRVYGKMGKPEKQKEAYERIAKEHVNSIFAAIAKEYLAG